MQIREKKRYSLSLTKAIMDLLHDQFETLGVTSQKRASALITLMVDDYLSQMTTHVMPIVIKAKQKGKEMTDIEFMRLVLDSLEMMRKP